MKAIDRYVSAISNTITILSAPGIFYSDRGPQLASQTATVSMCCFTIVLQSKGSGTGHEQQLLSNRTGLVLVTLGLTRAPDRTGTEDRKQLLFFARNKLKWPLLPWSWTGTQPTYKILVTSSKLITDHHDWPSFVLPNVLQSASKMVPPVLPLFRGTNCKR